MNSQHSRPAMILAGFFVVLGLGLAGCGQDREIPSAPASAIDAHPTQMASQARLWLQIANAENVYIGDSTDPWLKESWYTEAQSFDVVITNTSDFAIDDVYLLVTIPLAFKNVPGWTVQVGTTVLGPADFTGTNTDTYGFDGGSHGVYPPSGTGIFYPYPMNGSLAAHASWTVPVITTRGTADGFRLHFDGGSSRLWTPPSHDVTVLPPIGVESRAACCYGVDCVLTTEAECTSSGGFFYPELTICDESVCGGGGGEE